MSCKRSVLTVLVCLGIGLAGCAGGDGGNNGGNNNTTPAQNPIPTLSSMTPAAMVTHMPAFTLEVTGGNFVDGARVVFKGKEMDTTYVSATKLTCTVGAGDTVMASAGAEPLSAPQKETVTVLVRNPSPGGGDSGSLDFTVHDNFTFTTAEVLSHPDHDAWYPQFHVSPDGEVDVIWEETWGSARRVYMRHSGDGGETWSALRTVTTQDGSHYPTLCRDGDGNLHCAYNMGNAPSMVIRYTTSTNNGVTWSTPVTISSTWHTYLRILAGEQGRLRLFGSNPEIFVFRSNDGGATWGGPIQISNNYHSARVFSPAMDSQGNLFVAWIQEEGKGNYDERVWFSRSLDGGLTWMNQIRLRSVFVDHCYAPSIVATTNQRLVTAWHLQDWDGYGYDDYSVELRYANKLGNTWSATRVMHDLSRDGTNPALCADNAGNVGLFFCDSETKLPNWAMNLRFRRSTDAGTNWGDPVFIRNAPSLQFPRAACDGEGHAYLIFVDKQGERYVVRFLRSRIPD